MKVELIYNTGKKVIRDLTVDELFRIISIAPSDYFKSRIVESNLLENIPTRKKASAK
tara:strand:+ start:1038 stop:1208 length:171 start_codon:yes stop_codon:yes gene_type:complete